MSVILEQSFNLNNREEVIRFEAMMNAYSEKNILQALTHISLIDAYDFFSQRESGAKSFAALFDIYINFVLLYSDSISASKAWGGNGTSVEILESGTVFDSESKFFRKMEMHKFNTAFIFRYRALWDKLMGFTVLFFHPEQYESFVKAKSRRAKFRKILLENEYFPKEFVTHLDDHLDKFDNTHRTPEAHGTGSLRKRSFASQSFLESPVVEFSSHWNFILLYTIAIGKLFNKKKQ